MYWSSTRTFRIDEKYIYRISLCTSVLVQLDQLVHSGQFVLVFLLSVSQLSTKELGDERLGHGLEGPDGPAERLGGPEPVRPKTVHVLPILDAVLVELAVPQTVFLGLGLLRPDERLGHVDRHLLDLRRSVTGRRNGRTRVLTVQQLRCHIHRPQTVDVEQVVSQVELVE